MSVEIASIEKQLFELKKQLSEALKNAPDESVQNYQLLTLEGSVSLAELFGDRTDLLVIHNMGTGCQYCRLWADGLNGLLPHLESRTSIVLSSPDEPSVQREFAEARSWNFKLVSAKASTFNNDMNMEKEGLA